MELCLPRFGPTPASDPRENSGKTLQRSGPIRAFTTEISAELRGGGSDTGLRENDLMLANRT